MTLQEFLISISVNITSDALYDILKSFFDKEPSPTMAGLIKEMQKYLMIEKADITAEKIIEFLAKNGDIIISGSKIFAKEFIHLQSAHGTKFEIKDESSSGTEQTSITVGVGAHIRGSGGAAIQQSKDGIKFSI